MALSRKQKKAFLTAAVTAGVYLSFRYLLPLIFPFLAAYLMALLLQPSAAFLEKRLRISFRGRMIAALMVGSLLATVISLFLAFCVTHINLLQELKVRERAVAIYLMELEQRTELKTDELARLMEQNGIEVAMLSDEDVAALSAGTQRAS